MKMYPLNDGALLETATLPTKDVVVAVVTRQRMIQGGVLPVVTLMIMITIQWSFSSSREFFLEDEELLLWAPLTNFVCIACLVALTLLAVLLYDLSRHEDDDNEDDEVVKPKGIVAANDNVSDDVNDDDDDDVVVMRIKSVASLHDLEVHDSRPIQLPQQQQQPTTEVGLSQVSVSPILKKCEEYALYSPPCFTKEDCVNQETIDFGDDISVADVPVAATKQEDDSSPLLDALIQDLSTVFDGRWQDEELVDDDDEESKDLYAGSAMDMLSRLSERMDQFPLRSERSIRFMDDYDDDEDDNLDTPLLKEALSMFQSFDDILNELNEGADTMQMLQSLSEMIES